MHVVVVPIVIRGTTRALCTRWDRRQATCHDPNAHQRFPSRARVRLTAQSMLNDFRTTSAVFIRLALGATRARVIRLIVRQGMSLVGVGIVAGLVGAFFVTDQLSKQLFGVTATDPLTFVLVPLLVAAGALPASYLPSRLAARIEPHQALKSD